jgi:pimeloyl-ACP methyl ester carboxylesterase
VPDLDRARILQAGGYDVLAPKWTVSSEVPLESFPLDKLADSNDRLVVMGTSYGAEAALLLGALDKRVDAVIAFAPSAYVWARFGGTEAADRELGALAWDDVRRVLTG